MKGFVWMLSSALRASGILWDRFTRFASLYVAEEPCCALEAAAAAGPYTEVKRQLLDGADAAARALADLLVGDGVANADVHVLFWRPRFPRPIGAIDKWD